jgi:hypothetical protein
VRAHGSHRRSGTRRAPGPPGRVLGMLGFLLALTAAGSVGVYAVLSLVD